MTNLFLSFLNQEHYQLYYTPIAKIFNSVEAAIIFQEFVQRSQFHEQRQELIEIADKGNSWFFHTKEAIKDRTAINKYKQDKAVQRLKENGVIDTISHGMPCKRYIRLNLKGIEALSKKVSRDTKVERQGNRRSNDKETDLRTTGPYIEEPNEEPKRRRGNVQNPKSGSKPPPDFFFDLDTRKFIGITQKDLENWEKLYPSLDVSLEILEMEEWLKANPTRAKLKNLWRRFLTTWLKKSEEKASNQAAYRDSKNNFSSSNDPNVKDNREFFDRVLKVKGSLKSIKTSNWGVSQEWTQKDIPWNSQPPLFKQVLEQMYVA